MRRKSTDEIAIIGIIVLGTCCFVLIGISLATRQEVPTPLWAIAGAPITALATIFQINRKKEDA